MRPQTIPQLETAAIGAPITRLGVSFFPIFLTANQLPDIATGDDAGCRFDELRQAAVPSLLVRNLGKRPALLVEGEHLLGGKQNRTLNVSVLVAAGAEIELPVACLERGRWGAARNVQRAASYAPATVRAMNHRMVHASMREHGSRRGNQQAVWSAVDGVLNELGANSPTAAAAAADSVYRRDHGRRDAMRELAERGPLPGQCGIAVSNGRWVTAIELFGAPHLLRAHWRGMVRSHLMISRRPQGQPSATAALSVLRRFAFLPTRSEPGVGMGEERRGQDRWITGQALLLGRSFVHGTAFANEPAAAETDAWNRARDFDRDAWARERGLP